MSSAGWDNLTVFYIMVFRSDCKFLAPMKFKLQFRSPTIYVPNLQI